MPYTEDIRFLYRWDSRPPEVINKSGFQGAVNVYFNMSFGMRTVFCSASLKGSEYYFQELENGMSSYGGGILITCIRYIHWACLLLKFISIKIMLVL